MDKFQPGTVCYHKATNHRCVVLKTTEEMVKVRDEKNQEQDYYPVELETETERDAKNDAEIDKLGRINDDSDTGFGY